MRLGGRARAGITLLLGIIVGLGLVVLPGVLAPPSTTSTSTNSTSRVLPSTLTSSSGSQSNQPTRETLAGNIGGGLVILVGLVLFPAVALSILVRHLALKRARERLALGNQ